MTKRDDQMTDRELLEAAFDKIINSEVLDQLNKDTFAKVMAAGRQIARVMANLPH